MQRQKPPDSRPTAKLNPTLDRHLAAYVAAATTSGISLLAVGPARAEVAYTPANVTIGTSYALDLNHDGIADFTFDKWELFESEGHIFRLYLNFDVPGNAVRPYKQLRGAAAALPAGAKIGPLKSFTTFVGSYGDASMYGTSSFFRSGSDQHASFGPWVKQTNKYVGLRFLIGGQFHYGWARLTTDTVGGTVLTGYAYETNAGHRILAGQIGGNDAQPEFVPPATLGDLAAGTALGK